MMGVESVESKRRTNATKKRMDKGVAGRNIVSRQQRVKTEDCSVSRCDPQCRGGMARKKVIPMRR